MHPCKRNENTISSFKIKIRLAHNSVSSDLCYRSIANIFIFASPCAGADNQCLSYIGCCYHVTRQTTLMSSCLIEYEYQIIYIFFVPLHSWCSCSFHCRWVFFIFCLDIKHGTYVSWTKKHCSLNVKHHWSLALSDLVITTCPPAIFFNFVDVF